jgi:predicted secreted protein
MSDESGSTPEDQPTPPPYGEQPAAPPPPASPYGQQPPPPSPYGQHPAFGQQPAYGQMPAYGHVPPGGHMGSPPQNYLVWSILTTIFCCLPLGIVSIVYAAQVNSKWALGDVAGAHASSAKARQFAIWSVIASAILIALYIILIVGLIGANR